MFDVPDVSYARSGGVAIAYQVVGDGPLDVVYAPHLTNLLSLWVGRYSGPFLRRLAEDVREMREGWGERAFLTDFARVIDPVIAEDEELLDWFIWMHRLAASPTAAADFARMAMETDITDILGWIRVPTLILHREAQRGEAQYMAERIPAANAIELRGGGQGPYSVDVVEALLSFVRGGVASPIPDSVLAKVLFTDLVGSTQRAAGSSVASAVPHGRSRALAGSSRTPARSTSRCGRGSTRASARSPARRSPGSRCTWARGSWQRRLPERYSCRAR